MPEPVFFFKVAKSALLAGAGVVAAALTGGAIWLWLSAPRAVSGGKEMSFPVQPAERTVRLLALGDTGTGGEWQMRVAAAMESWCNRAKEAPIDGILLLGDNFYSEGVASVRDEQWQTKFEQPYGSPCLSRIPVYPVLGNHDYRLSPQAQIDYSVIQPRWRMPARFYSVDFGPVVRLVVIDTNRVDWCGSPQNCVVDFMNARLGAGLSGASPGVQFQGWRILTGHHPMGSSSTHGRSYDGTLFKYTLRPQVCKRADLYLSGHAHQMEHLRFEGCNTDFIVAGTGGADLGGVKEGNPDTHFLKQDRGFVVLEMSLNQLSATFVDERLNEVYRLERSRS